MIKTDGSAMQPVTPNSHDSYNLADMGARRTVGLHAVARGQREDGDLRLGGERIARAPGQSPTTPGLVPGLVAEGWPDRVHQRGLLGSSRALALHGATERDGTRSADASTVPAFGRTRRRTPRTVGASSSNRTGATTTSAAAICSSCRRRGEPRSGCTCRSMPTSRGGGRRRSCPRRGSPRVSSRSRAGRRARSSGRSRCSATVRSDRVRSVSDVSATDPAGTSSVSNRTDQGGARCSAISGHIEIDVTEPMDVTGFHVEAADGRIGKVDEATYDVGSAYLVVDTGPWIFGRKVVIPAGTVTRARPRQRAPGRGPHEGSDQGLAGVQAGHRRLPVPGVPIRTRDLLRPVPILTSLGIAD